MGEVATRVRGMEKSSTEDSWCTPRHIVDRVRDLGEGRIALDPCSNPNSIVGADVEWFGPPNGSDGLLLPWSKADGLIYVNPPYTEKYAWTWKCHVEHQRNIGCEIVALLPADTDTQWFQRFAAKAQKRCFLDKRLKFHGDRNHGARFPSVVIYWGIRPHKFIAAFEGAGWIV